MCSPPRPHTPSRTARSGHARECNVQAHRHTTLPSPLPAPVAGARAHGRHARKRNVQARWHAALPPSLFTDTCTQAARITRVLAHYILAREDFALVCHSRPCLTIARTHACSLSHTHTPLPPTYALRGGQGDRLRRAWHARHRAGHRTHRRRRVHDVALLGYARRTSQRSGGRCRAHFRRGNLCMPTTKYLYG